MPKFCVGEQVIHVSKTYPEYNGLHIIRAVVYDGDSYHDRIINEGFIIANKDGYGYVLEDIILDEDGGEVHWAESSLRKLPPKSDYSFDELVTRLKIADKEFLEA